MKRESEKCRSYRIFLFGVKPWIKCYRRGPITRNPDHYVVISEYEKGDHSWISFVYVNNIRHFKKKVDIHSWKTTNMIIQHFHEWDDKLGWVFNASSTIRPHKFEQVTVSYHPKTVIYEHEFWMLDLIPKFWFFDWFSPNPKS